MAEGEIIIDDGIVTKIPYDGINKYTCEVLTFLQSLNLECVPEILEVNEELFRYRYVEGEVLGPELHTGLERIKTLHQVLEIKMAMDKCWKVFYDVSIEKLKTNQFLYHNDLHLDNIVYDFDTKRLVLLDLESFCIGWDHVPLAYLGSHFYHELEKLLIKLR